MPELSKIFKFYHYLVNIMHEFIVLEGLDGIGKSTIGKKLSEIMGARFVETPMGDFELLKKNIFKKTFDIQFLYFMASNLDASYEIKKMTEDSPVICARYLYTTIVAYCTYTGATLEQTMKKAAPFMQNLIMPDQTIVLHVSETGWHQRMLGRGGFDANDRRLLENRKYRSRAVQIYDVLVEKEGWLKFDTTGRTIDECVSELYRFLRH